VPLEQGGLIAVAGRVRGQAQGLPMEAPILLMEVVRVEPMGVGLRFVSE